MNWMALWVSTGGTIYFIGGRAFYKAMASRFGRDHVRVLPIHRVFLTVLSIVWLPWILGWSVVELIRYWTGPKDREPTIEELAKDAMEKANAKD